MTYISYIFPSIHEFDEAFQSIWDLLDYVPIGLTSNEDIKCSFSSVNCPHMRFNKLFNFLAPSKGPAIRFTTGIDRDLEPEERVCMCLHPFKIVVLILRFGSITFFIYMS